MGSITNNDYLNEDGQYHEAFKARIEKHKKAQSEESLSASPSKGESPGSILEDTSYQANPRTTPTRVIFACAACEHFIEHDEVVVRTNEGWLPYHPVCAPDPSKFHFQLRIKGGC